MGKYLEELAKTSARAVRDPEEVGGIVTALAYEPLSELPYGMRWEAGNMLRITALLPSEKAKELCFAEYLSLLRISCCLSKASDYAAKLRIPFSDFDNMPLKMSKFSEVAVKAFTSFVDSKSDSLKGSSVYERVCDIAADNDIMIITALTTFKQLFRRITMLTADWNGQCSIVEFAKRAAACAQIIKLLMVDCFRFAFGDMFVLTNLKNKLVEDADTWENKKAFEKWFGTGVEGVSKYDRVDMFGDEYDTDADQYLPEDTSDATDLTESGNARNECG